MPSPAAHAFETFNDLPYDMQVLLEQFLEEYDCNWSALPLQDSTLPLIDVPVAPLARVAETFDWDDRGEEHVRQMAETIRTAPHELPPIVVGKEQAFMDGRHRLLAARTLGLETLPAIDFPAWVESVAPGSKPRVRRGMRP